MNLFIFPQLAEEVDSSLNGKITVLKQFGRFTIFVSGTEQSGSWVKKVWSKVPLTGKNVLILGLGCGVVAKLLPNAKSITGIEIDPKMLSLGKKYFALGDIKNLKIIQGDAQNLPKRQFDLVLVDTYLGKTFPKAFESPHFLSKLSQTVSKNGSVIFNRLTTKNANFKLEKFVDKLQKYFTITSVKKVDFNTLIICSRRRSEAESR